MKGLIRRASLLWEVEKRAGLAMVNKRRDGKWDKPIASEFSWEELLKCL